MSSVSSTSSPEHPTARRGRFGVRDGGGNGQLGLGTGGEFTPDRESSTDKFGAFVHTRQTMVSGAPASIQDGRINALAVVPDSQPKLPLVVTNFHSDPLRVGVSERIAQRLAGNPIDFAPQQRSEVARCTFYHHTKVGRILTAGAGSKFVTKGTDR